MIEKSILIFGIGELQQSLIERCKQKVLYTIGIDPSEIPVCKNLVDVFERVEGGDFKRTLHIAKKYNVSGVITTATDKPLIMMARVAEKLNLPFYTVETAEVSTDKWLMKQRFIQYDIPCAQGYIINCINELYNLNLAYPLIVKPRDNSGSRGVIRCHNVEELALAITEAFDFTKKENVLVEEFIEGKEYSVEGIHCSNHSHVIQITEKITSNYPYNVELGHIQPADLSVNTRKIIQRLLNQIAKAFGFNNCASHTELKINSKGIFIIETSPRMGGDFITSHLVPLSTGINMQDILIDISMGNPIENNSFNPILNHSSGIKYIELPEGEILSIKNLEEIYKIEGLYAYNFNLHIGGNVTRITNSLNRYGYAIFKAVNKNTLNKSMNLFNQFLKNNIFIRPN